MRWPSNYPEGCPPADSYNADGSLFRLANRSSYAPQDFLSAYALEVKRVDKGTIPEIRDEYSNCQARGLSVYRTYEDTVKAMLKIPSLSKKKALVEVDSNQTGLLKNTPNKRNPSHYTWWIPNDIDLGSKVISVHTKGQLRESLNRLIEQDGELVGNSND